MLNRFISICLATKHEILSQLHFFHGSIRNTHTTGVSIIDGLGIEGWKVTASWTDPPSRPRQILRGVQRAGPGKSGWIPVCAAICLWMGTWISPFLWGAFFASPGWLGCRPFSWAEHGWWNRYQLRWPDLREQSPLCSQNKQAEPSMGTDASLQTETSVFQPALPSRGHDLQWNIAEFTGGRKL